MPIGRGGESIQVVPFGPDINSDALYDALLDAIYGTKAFLVDHSSVMVGTLNFDNRSFFLNYEIVSIGYSSGMIKDVELWILDLFENVQIGMKPVGRVRKILENLGRIIAPQI